MVYLGQFQGWVARQPELALVFLQACLGISGFPISPIFIGGDLIFSRIYAGQAVLAFFGTLRFIIGGLAIIRICPRPVRWGRTRSGAASRPTGHPFAGMVFSHGPPGGTVGRWLVRFSRPNPFFLLF